MHSIIEFSFLQLVGSESGRVPMVGIIPHALCPSEKGLDPALDESTDQLKARHLLFGCGS
jgi:hypothetical protein